MLSDDQPAPPYPSDGYNDCHSWSSVRWIQAAEGVIPPQAVVGGYEGETTYIGRAKLHKAIVPGRVIPSKKACMIAYKGGQHVIHDYQVLCGYEGQFAPTERGICPVGSLQGGVTRRGKPLYIGLARQGMFSVVCCVNPEDRCCYAPIRGYMKRFNEYEIFVSKVQGEGLHSPWKG